MKIAVILTGGTIASTVNGGVISLGCSPAERLEKAYKDAGGTAELEFSSPFTVLSENLCAENLNQLTGAVLAEYASGTEKIIICHGSDTLAYSAAAVMYALAGKSCTAVFVSAAKPLECADTNGFENFNAAAFFLENHDIRGVFAANKNQGEPARILPAARLALHPECGDDLFCINGEYAAEYACSKTALNPSFKPSEQKALGFAPQFEAFSGIQIVTAAPGQKYPPCENGVRAVILRPYHSGTLNTASAAFSDFCLDAKRRGIPVFAVNIRQGTRYESALEYARLGITPLEGAAFAAVYVKIWLAAHMRGEELERFVKTPAAGEVGG